MTTNEKALLLHEEWKGKLETTSKAKVASREDLALAYTPGVAEPCKVIAGNPEAAYRYTIKSNTIAVVSDGSEMCIRDRRHLICTEFFPGIPHHLLYEQLKQRTSAVADASDDIVHRDFRQ